MAVARLNIMSEYLRSNTSITIILPNKHPTESSGQHYISGRKYKVLWLLHGGMGDDTDWIRHTQIEDYCADNEIIGVCPCAYNSSYSNWSDFGSGLYMTEYFFKELMPMIYNWFPASSSREDNYIAGLSMGGQGALKYSLMHPECFTGCIMMSSRAEQYPDYYLQQVQKPHSPTINLIKSYGSLENFMMSDDNIREKMLNVSCNNTQVTKVYHTIGNKDKHFQEYQEFKLFCESNNFDWIDFHEVDGYGHEWPFWNIAIKSGLTYFNLI